MCKLLIGSLRGYQAFVHRCACPLQGLHCTSDALWRKQFGRRRRPGLSQHLVGERAGRRGRGLLLRTTFFWAIIGLARVLVGVVRSAGYASLRPHFFDASEATTHMHHPAELPLQLPQSFLVSPALSCKSLIQLFFSVRKLCNITSTGRASSPESGIKPWGAD